MNTRRAVERATFALSLIACLSFVLNLYDVKLRDVRSTPQAPPPPASAGARDASLLVHVRELAADCETSDCEGPAVPDASVRVFWERDGIYYLAGSGTSDGRGDVVIDQLPEGVVWVLSESSQLARTSTQLALGGERRETTLLMGPRHELLVSVQDEAGEPLPGATVLVNTGDPLPFGELTGSDGSVRLDRLGAPPWTLKVSARGYESVTRSGVTSDVTVTLRRLGVLEVRVELSDGSPAEGATLVVAGDKLWPARRTETDARGLSTIAGLLDGAYDLRAIRGQLLSETLYGVQLENGEHKSVVLRLVPGRSVTALVTDGEEENALVVPNADVVLVESGLSAFPLRGRTGSDGTVTLGPISGGPATLAARAPDFVPRGGVPVPEAVAGPVRIPLVKGGTLLGEVVDARGFPVDGASIEIIGSDLSGLPVSETPVSLAFSRAHFAWALAGPVPLIPAGELGVMPGPVPPIPAPGALFEGTASQAGPQLFEDEEPIEPWVTRFDGSFRAHPVTPGRIRALVRHPAYVEGLSDAVTLAPGGEAKVKVVLKAGGTLEGRVIDGRGRPVSGARVDLTALRGTLERTTFSADDGSFAFAAVPEEVMLSVARPDDLSRIVLRKPVEVEEGKRTEIEITLPEARETITVVVQDERGRAVPAAQVTLISLDPLSPLRRTLFTDQEGKADFDDARGLSLRALVEAPSFARLVLNVDRAPETLKLELTRGVQVVGRVTAVRGRVALAGASVTLVADGVRSTTITDDEGSYQLRDVASGNVKLVVNHPEYASNQLDVKVVQTGRSDRAFELPTIDLAEAGTVEGRVLDKNGKPVLAARIAIGGVPAYLPIGSLPEGMAQSDTQGRFTLRGVAPGKLELEAYAADVGRGRVRVEVSSGRTSSGVEIRLNLPAGEDVTAAPGSIAVTLGENGSGDELDVVVVLVAALSDAERAGLKAGDILVAIDGVEPYDMRDARERLSGPVNSDVVVEIWRNESTHRLTLTREAVRR